MERNVSLANDGMIGDFLRVSAKNSGDLCGYRLFIRYR